MWAGAPTGTNYPDQTYPGKGIPGREVALQQKNNPRMKSHAPLQPPKERWGRAAKGENNMKKNWEGWLRGGWSVEGAGGRLTTGRKKSA